MASTERQDTVVSPQSSKPLTSNEQPPAPTGPNSAGTAGQNVASDLTIEPTKPKKTKRVIVVRNGIQSVSAANEKQAVVSSLPVSSPTLKKTIVVPKVSAPSSATPQTTAPTVPIPTSSSQTAVAKADDAITDLASKQATANKSSEPGTQKAISTWIARGLSSTVYRLMDRDDNDRNDDHHDISSDDDDDFYGNSDNESNNGDSNDDGRNDRARQNDGARSEPNQNDMKGASKGVSNMTKMGQNSQPLHRGAQSSKSGMSSRTDAISQSVPDTKSQTTADNSHTGLTSGHDHDLEKSAMGQKAQATKVSTVEIDEKMQHNVRRPASPPRSSRFLGLGLFEVSIKVFNILFPLFFVALGIIHIIQVGQPFDSDFTMAVTQARTIAITLWPIMFAAIATQSLKAYGTFQAERGIKLMTLEQLLHSTSFSSAIRQPMLLRRLDWMSVLLFVLWALSPLASQALQRMAYLGPNSTSIQTTVNYTREDGQYLSNHAYLVPDTAPRNAFFGAALVSPSKVRQSPQDTWGNPKTPMMNQFSSPDDEGWYTVFAQDESGFVAWTSLVGTPVTNPVPENQSSSLSFTIDTGYFDFECPDLQQVSPSSLNSSYSSIQDFQMSLTLETAAGYSGSNNGTANWAFRVESSVDGLTALSYGVTSCKFSLVQVSNWVECVAQGAEMGSSCQVTKVRPANVPDIAQGYTLTSGTFESFFLSALTPILNQTLSVTGFFLINPTAVFDKEGDGSSLLDLSGSTLSTRITQLINTYFKAAGDKAAYTVGIHDSTSVVSTQAIMVDTTLVWKVSIEWIVVYFFSAMVILLFAIADVFWEATTVSPNFLGFASNIVRNNQALRREFQGRKLSGYERARAMAELKVVLQDVSPDRDVGKIALAPANSGSTRLQRDRSYL